MFGVNADIQFMIDQLRKLLLQNNFYYKFEKEKIYKQNNFTFHEIK